MPATLAVASNCVALRAVPYVMEVGVGQLMEGIACASPFKVTVWETLVPFRLLSVSTIDSLRAPVVVGSKLIDNSQSAPAARVPASAAPELTTGQAKDPLLLSEKSVPMAGLFPLAGTANDSGALPMLTSVSVCGLLLLPCVVAEKVSVCGSETSTRTTL